jgi:hypothetical protein
MSNLFYRAIPYFFKNASQFQEDFSNRMGKGFFDIYLKHQNTKTRRQTGQHSNVRQTGRVEDFGRNLIEQLDRSARTNASSSPGQNSLKSENFAFD